ncbi:hypothetical protein [Thermodesulfatator atlanticus]|uniref:hypothetical protein n=1 Tax=Thermodesulfatator atlanticus TaxID=501497 RepID=UPI0003B4C185|nr:hypothetical protein [Thermodesulfatator atlanticus]
MRFILLLVLPFLLGACGGPKYVIKERYLAPMGLSGEICLKECQQKFEKCQQNCQKEYQKCLAAVRVEAKEIYQKELLSYQNTLTTYEEELRLYRLKLSRYQENLNRLKEDYQFFKKICKRDKDQFACRRKDELAKKLARLKGQRPIAPLKPKRPSLTAIITELSATCVSDCGCKDLYDKCFLSCGGSIIPEKICVENCDEKMGQK